jgi:hypothetical protein
MVTEREYLRPIETVDKKVEAMRLTARRVGLTQLLVQIHQATADPVGLSERNHERLGKALELLGATDEEVEL